MNKSYALRAFRKAGYPLIKRTGYYEYASSVVHIRAIPLWEDREQVTLTAWFKGSRHNGLHEFESVEDTLRYIRNRLAIQCVVSNDWALPNPDKAPALTLIVGGAA